MIRQTDPAQAQTGPIRAALLVSHGQPSDPEPAEATLQDFAQRLRPLLPGWQLLATTLAQPGGLERARDRLPDGALVYPLFMSDGWFVRSALPRRLGAKPMRVLAPLGSDPGLAQAAGAAVMAQLIRQGWHDTQTDLLIAAHGSARSDYARKATELFAQRLSNSTNMRAIHIGFVEQTPEIGQAARLCGTQALCLPFFFAQGDHVRDDVDGSLHAAGFTGPRLNVMADLPEVPDLIARSLRAAI